MSETLAALGLEPESAHSDPNLFEDSVGRAYRVELFDDGIEPYFIITTYDNWQIEGDFLVVWTRDGVREAYRIDKRCSVIRTFEVAQGKHVNEEEDVDDDASTDSDTNS